MGEEWNETFIGIPHAILPSYREGFLVGTHTPHNIQTADEYKLTTNEDGLNVFRRANGDTVTENECYLKYDSPNDVIFASQEDAATGIKGLTQPLSKGKETVIYNITGQRISKMQKGIDILSGKKILR